MDTHDDLKALVRDPDKLADLMKDWRKRLKISVDTAADLLDMSKRTINGIEQGRGFSFGLLLIQTMISIELEWEARVGHAS